MTKHWHAWESDDDLPPEVQEIHAKFGAIAPIPEEFLDQIREEGARAAQKTAEAIFRRVQLNAFVKAQLHYLPGCTIMQAIRIARIKANMSESTVHRIFYSKPKKTGTED